MMDSKLGLENLLFNHCSKSTTAFQEQQFTDLNANWEKNFCAKSYQYLGIIPFVFFSDDDFSLHYLFFNHQ